MNMVQIRPMNEQMKLFLVVLHVLPNQVAQFWLFQKMLTNAEEITFKGNFPKP